MDYLTQIAQELGTSVWLLVIILIWTLIWKLIAMWKAARGKQVIWFMIFAFFNTVGILPILYIYVFSKIKKKEIKKPVRRLAYPKSQNARAKKKVVKKKKK
jgi:hypothetical protein